MADNNTTAGSPGPGGQGFPADNADGTPALVGPDEYTRNLRIQRAQAQPQAALAGNFADLQRLGAQAANTGSDDAFAVPPGLDPKDKNVVSGIEAEGNAGIYNRETERYGLVDAPPEPVPAEDKSPNSVDPTSVSPTTQTAGQSTSSTPASPLKK